MKKIAFILAILFVGQVNTGCSVFQSGTTVKKGKLKKNGRYKQKSRLFSGKNQCDCPKH